MKYNTKKFLPQKVRQNKHQTIALGYINAKIGTSNTEREVSVENVGKKMHLVYANNKNETGY